MKNLKVFLLMSLLVPAISMAKTFTNEEHGYTIDIDDGYRVTRGDDVTFFESEDRSRIIIVINRPGLTDEMAWDNITRGHQDQNIAIVADAESKQKKIEVEHGKAVLIDVKGVFERKLIKGVAGGYTGDDGQGLVVLVSATESAWDEFAPEAEKITASVKFIAYRPALSASEWYPELSGTRLTYRGAVDGQRRRENLNLCSDGSFLHRMTFSAMRESDSAANMGYSTKTRSGIWEVVDDDGNSRLLLFYNDGPNESAIIEKRDGRIFLDGRYYDKLRKNRCR